MRVILAATVENHLLDHRPRQLQVESPGHIGNANQRIGKLYVALPVVGKGAKGLMGSMYDCEPAILRKLENINLPCLADIEQQDVMRFGERKQEIASISPLPPEMVPSRPAAGTAVAKAA